MQSGADVIFSDDPVHASLLTGKSIAEKLNQTNHPLHEDFFKAKFSLDSNDSLKNESSVSYYQSLNTLTGSVQELTAAEDRLSDLHDEREITTSRYSENQKAVAAAVHEKIDSGMVFLIEGDKDYSALDIYALPVDQQALLKNSLSATTEQLEKLTSIVDVIKTYPEDHVMRRAFDANGISENSFLPHTLRVESILKKMVSSIVTAMNEDSPKRAAKISTVITKQLKNTVAPFQPLTLELDKMLYQNDKSVALMLAQIDLVQAEIRELLNRLTYHPEIQNNGEKKDAIDELFDVLSAMHVIPAKAGTHSANTIKR